MTETGKDLQDAFALKRLSDDVVHIVERHVDPWLRANIWLISGRDNALLIDSGMGLWPLKPIIQRLVEKPVLCLSTHCHFDHAGGAHEFSERLSHGSEAAILSNPDRDNVLIERFIGPQSVQVPPGESFTPETYTIKPCPPTRPVDEGDVIDLGDRHFRVIHLPGHSPGSIGVYEQHSGMLFTGDAIYDGELYDDYYHSNPEAYQETMARLMEMQVTTVHPGHNDSFSQMRFKELAGDYLAGRRIATCPGRVDR